jgi:ferrous iron transport protein B
LTNTDFSSPHKKNAALKVALLGNPNCGKSTLFNLLTGLNQQIGNFPGVTVDKRSGYFYLKDKSKIELLDLPGTYSLFPKSLDEELAVNILTDPSNENYPNLSIVVADASNLKRSLFLCTQVIDLKIPVILALNMMDLAEKNGIAINTAILSDQLGIPVVELNARKGQGVEELKLALSKNSLASEISIVDIEQIENKAINDIARVLKVNCAFASFIVANNLHNISYFNHNKEKKEEVKNILELNQFDARKLQALESIERYRQLSKIIGKIVSKKNAKPSRTYAIDKVLTHKYWGYLIFLAVLFAVFQTIFSFASYPMDLIDTGFGAIATFINNNLPNGVFKELIVNGILAGLSGVVIFVPQIAMLFAFISILEDSGYMARVSFIMDRLMQPFGLNGRSVIPLISGVACAVPAIMSARTISNYKERLITILVTPLMSCSARLPVYTLLVSILVPNNAYVWIFNKQALILMAFYIIGFIAALLFAVVFKWILKTKERSFFIMELPFYKAPRWKNVGLTILEKVKVFLFDAGKVIIAISIVLWVLSSYGPGKKFEDLQKNHQQALLINNANTDSLETVLQSQKLENSYAGILGKTIEPAIKPIGFDWKIGIALITSFAAREVFVGTMATIYSVGNTENTTSIRQKMIEEKNPVTGAKVYTTGVCLSLMFFYAFAMQCMSTIAVVYRETKSWKWPVIQFVLMGALAYLSSLLAFTIF